MDSNEIYLKMAELWAEMSLEHSKPSKAAHGRARSAGARPGQRRSHGAAQPRPAGGGQVDCRCVFKHVRL